MKSVTSVRQQVQVCLGKAEIPVGTLIYVKQGRRENTTFAYEQGWLGNQDGFNVSADLSLISGYQPRRAPSAHDSVFHFAIADTAPDAWGRRVIARDHAKRRKGNPSLASLTEMDYLLAVDDFNSRSDLLAARDRVLVALEAEIYIADATYRALEAVRMQTVAAVEARLPTLKEMRTINTKATMPALVLAWQVNGSIAAYDDIVARNKVRHPCFVPAGKVEVMLDGE